MATRFKRNAKGEIVIRSKTFKKMNGSRREVMNGSAFKTTGGLTKKGLRYVKTKTGRRIVSKKKSIAAKTSKNPLRKLGLLRKKGSKGFKLVSRADIKQKK